MEAQIVQKQGSEKKTVLVEAKELEKERVWRRKQGSEFF